MFDESDLLPLSGLQHLAFCERQWGLIHIEQAWSENVLTAQGRVLHERAHEAGNESRGDRRIARGVRLRSLRLGLAGIADVIEFHRILPHAQAPGAEETTAQHNADPRLAGVPLPGARGLWRPFPVEYKRGRPKAGDADRVQLCAQALCLEEMLGIVIQGGALFYGEPHRRTDVSFDEALRDRTERLADRMQELFAAGVTPPGIYEKKCQNCSLLELCGPKKIQPSHSARHYLARALDDLSAECIDANEDGIA